MPSLIMPGLTVVHYAQSYDCITWLVPQPGTKTTWLSRLA